MKSLIRGLIGVGTLIFGVGLAKSFWPQKGFAESLSKSQQVYWEETQLKEKDLLDLISSDSCQSSQKYFLACVNAIQNVAQRYQLELELDGTFSEAPTSETGILTEKAILQPWQSLYLTNQNQVMTLSFVDLWQNLKSKKMKSEEIAISASLGLNGFLSIFKDPHTYLLPAAYYNEVVAQIDPKSMSLGVVVAKGTDEYFVRKVLDSSPADLAGLKKGDLLLEVNQQRIQSYSLQKVADLMKAEEGETTRLLIQRGSDVKSYHVQRTSRLVPTVSWKFQAAKQYAILTINKFARGSCEKTQEAILDIQKKSARGLLVDLRDNSGGQMEEAACIASLFIGKNREILTLQYRDQKHEIETMYGPHDQIFFGAMGVLINSGTASAAEILAGVLQEYHRAVLVGERTFGKGTFQEGEIWDENSKIALFETKGFFMMPSGRSPQLVGILPDVAVEFKKAKSLREEDLYMNPLRPKTATPLANIPNSFKLDRCLDSKNESFSILTGPEDHDFDPQLDRASALLSCPTVANTMTGF